MNEHDPSSLPYENRQITSGPLRSAITIELHTHYATRIWTGRQASPAENIHAIIGMPRFLSLLNIIRLDILTDNPYADMWMLRLEERLLAARDEMNTLFDNTKTCLSQLPDMLTVENCLSIQPARFPVFASSQLGFIAVYLLTDYDRLMRHSLLANHMALLSRTVLNDLRQRGGTLLRSIFTLAQKYRRIPVTREDFRTGNARAAAAEETVGPLPADILDGTRRSQYAPPLRHSPVNLPAPVTESEADAEGTTSAEMQITAAEPTEPADAPTTGAEDDCHESDPCA